MTETVTTSQLAVALDWMATALVAAYDRPNAADACFGVGDDGTMLWRGAIAIQPVAAYDGHACPAELLDHLKQAVAAGSGSSLGNLLAVGQRAAAHHAGDHAALSHYYLSDMLETAAKQMRRADGALPDNKTVIDLLDALRPPLADGADATAVLAATNAMMAELRDRPVASTARDTSQTPAADKTIRASYPPTLRSVRSAP